MSDTTPKTPGERYVAAARAQADRISMLIDAAILDNDVVAARTAARLLRQLGYSKDEALALVRARHAQIDRSGWDSLTAPTER